MTLSFYDWDGDGDQDFFPGFHRRARHGQDRVLSKHDRRKTAVVSLPHARWPASDFQRGRWPGRAPRWRPVPRAEFAKDWDGDGDNRTDLIVGSNNHCYLYRNLGSDGAGGWRLADAVTIQSDGADIAA